jgi:hypothetical protein
MRNISTSKTSVHEQYHKDLHNLLHCLRNCRRSFVLRFIVTKLIPAGAIDIKGACWLIKAIWLRHA